MIFYFTGTGNSLVTAQRLSNRDTLVSIGDAMRKEIFNYDAGNESKIGFVMPVYCFGIPSIVLEFIDKLKLLKMSSAYIYLVLTCGGKTGAAGDMFAKALKAKGITLDARFSVKFASNYIVLSEPPLPPIQEKIQKNASRAIIGIREQLNKRVPGDHDGLKGILPSMVTALAYPFYSRMRSTKNFNVNTKCKACGACANHCPERAIEMHDGIPVWVQPKCTLCMACINRCPCDAINIGKRTEGRRRYVNHHSGL